MAKNAIARLAEAIGYPEKVPDGVVSFAFQVDGGEIDAVEAGGKLRLSFRLDDDGGASLPRFAAYAAGRMLREDATLAYGRRPEIEGRMSNVEGAAFLWQETPADADGFALRRRFEDFCASCDWWRERAAPGAGGDGGSPRFPEMTIRP